MRLVYNFSIISYGWIIRLASLFNGKARLWIDGRKELFGKLEEAFADLDRKKNPVIWFHASSLGEFEQGRPVIESFRKSFPSYRILLTFFSPSGYEVRKNYDQADWIFYLPLDTRKNVSRWMEIVQPTAIVFIKYDFWFNYLQYISLKKIPVYYISVIFRPGQYFFKWYGGWFRKQIAGVTHFFVQNQNSSDLLGKIGLKKVTVAGDTRFDRVYEIASQKHSFPLIEKFIDGKMVFIGGSTWREDEALLIPLIHKRIPGLKFIVAPHDTGPGRIQQITSQIDRSVVKYSELTPGNAQQADVLLIDSVGILAQLYQYATLAFIGGGFGSGLHNIQEPITYGVPVFVGPGYHKFKEAVDLVGLGGVLCVTTTRELAEHTERILADPSEHKRLSDLCRSYVNENRGATAIIIKYFERVFDKSGS